MLPASRFQLTHYLPITTTTENHGATRPTLRHDGLTAIPTGAHHIPHRHGRKNSVPWRPPFSHFLLLVLRSQSSWAVRWADEILTRRAQRNVSWPLALPGPTLSRRSEESVREATNSGNPSLPRRRIPPRATPATAQPLLSSVRSLCRLPIFVLLSATGSRASSALLRPSLLKSSHQPVSSEVPAPP